MEIVPCHPHPSFAASMVTAVGPVRGMGRAMHSLRRNRIVIGSCQIRGYSSTK